MGKLRLRYKHRIMCGDSTDADAVATLMDGNLAELVFTSPPYAQQRDYGAAKEKATGWDVLMQGVFAVVPGAKDVQLLVNLGLVHREGEWIPYWSSWIEWMRAAGWRRFGFYVWDQGPGLPGDWNGRLAPAHEFIFHFNRESRHPNKIVPNKNAGVTMGEGGLRGADGTIKRKTGAGKPIQEWRIPDSVIRENRHCGAVPGGKHPAVFSVGLAEFVVNAYSAEGGIIYEPFCGSGTQVIAAEKTGRRCFAMDIDPAYIDVALRRWSMFTGSDDCVHEGRMATFKELQAWAD